MTSPRARMEKPYHPIDIGELAGESPRAHGETASKRAVSIPAIRVPARAWRNQRDDARIRSALPSPRARMEKPNREYSQQWTVYESPRAHGETARRLFPISPWGRVPARAWRNRQAGTGRPRRAASPRARMEKPFDSPRTACLATESPRAHGETGVGVGVGVGVGRVPARAWRNRPIPAREHTCIPSPRARMEKPCTAYFPTMR